MKSSLLQNFCANQFLAVFFVTKKSMLHGLELFSVFLFFLIVYPENPIKTAYLSVRKQCTIVNREQRILCMKNLTEYQINHRIHQI